MCVVDSDVFYSFTNNCQIINPTRERDKENYAKFWVCHLTCINHKDIIPNLSLPPCMLFRSFLFMLPNFHIIFLFSSACFFSFFISHDISLKPNTILYTTLLCNKNSIRLQSLIDRCPSTRISLIPHNVCDNVWQKKSPFQLDLNEEIRLCLPKRTGPLDSTAVLCSHVNVSNIGVAEGASTQVPCDPFSIFSCTSEMTDRWRGCARLISHLCANRCTHL